MRAVAVGEETSNWSIVAINDQRDSTHATRLGVGEADPVTGKAYTGPVVKARLEAGDRLVVVETGMLDQATARALLTVVDECQVRVALIGDRRSASALGGRPRGVLDLAAGHVEWAAHLMLTGVHRFIRIDRTGRAAPDLEYADLTLAMRAGEVPEVMFDALAA